MSDRDPHDRTPGEAGPADDPTRDAPPSTTTPEDVARGQVSPDAIAPEATARGADMGPASLAGIDGMGTLQVVRDREGDVLHVEGTWRPHDGQPDLSALDAAISAGHAVRYEGGLHDPGNPENERCSMHVTITSRSEYTYDAREEDDGRTRPLFNFRPANDQALPR